LVIRIVLDDFGTLINDSITDVLNADPFGGRLMKLETAPKRSFQLTLSLSKG
jgi:hypothetical protein